MSNSFRETRGERLAFEQNLRWSDLIGVCYLKLQMIRYFAVTWTFLAFLLIQPAMAFERVDIQGPAGSQRFGETVIVLPNGNFVVIDFLSNSPITEVGAVYLYDGATKQLISRLHGTHYFDRVGGGGINVLPSGDFIVRSPDWQNQRGAITYCRNTTGCDGAVSAANSLTGTETGGLLGNLDPVILTNGNYVVRLSGYINAGAVTLCSGTSPTVGQISAENSLIGERPNDRVGQAYVTALSNGGYVVESPNWFDGRGAVTFCDGVTGCRGLISVLNSLVGQNPGHRVGNSPVYMESAVKEVGNGNYLVISSSWDHGGVQDAGAVTWLSPATGLNGFVTSSNSLVGAAANTKLGQVTVLPNGNYVVLGAAGNTGGVTFGDGATGVFGVVSEANSLVGTGTNNDFYLASVVPLTNGNYVVNAPTYKVGSTLTGGARFCNGTTGCVGRMSESNSLAGVGNYGYSDPVTPLTNGNYVVRGGSSATFGNGTTGVTGRITQDNSLISPNHGGLGLKIVPLPNGNYYVLNAWWDPPAAPGSGSRGAVTFGNGQTGTAGIVSEANSLVNERSGDTSEFSFRLLPSGDLLLLNSRWNSSRGALTVLSGTAPQVGVIAAQNSVVGTNPYDYVGGNVNVLANGNYVVVANNWNGVRGAVRLCKTNESCTGELTETNSLVGTNPNDRVGGGNNLTGIIAVNNTHFVVSSPNWNGDRGAATLVDASKGIVGPISAANSLTGSAAMDLVSNGYWVPVVPLLGTKYLGDGLVGIYSPNVDIAQRTDAGAVTIARIHDVLAGTVNTGNSFIGGPTDGGWSLRFEYDRVNRQVVIGRMLANAVTVIKPDNVVPPFARIRGTLKTPDGSPARYTMLKITGPDGYQAVRWTKLNGNFEFHEVPTRQRYTITVVSKRFAFATRVVDDLIADTHVGDIVGMR